MFLSVQNVALLFWKLSAYVCRIENLETKFFSADQRRKCLSARCASTANATDSYTDMLHVSSISITDLLYFDTITN